MKKFLTALLGAIVVSLSALGFTACGGKDSGGISVYMPDGAPALALASLMSVEADFGKGVTYRVVDATEISSRVTYNDMNKNADICVLPVNEASKHLGDGAKYKMLGTVTHGNLYIVSASDTVLTRENFATEISNKKVGVVQMAKFPGAAFKLLLNDYGVTQSVTLQPVTPAEVTGVSPSCDYFVIPEPAATTRVSNSALQLNLVGSLQELYGEGNGYPQAVLVAKNSLIEKEPEFIAQFTKSLDWCAEWLLSGSVTGTDIFNAVKAHYADPENTTPAFTAAQLNNEGVIRRCAISFQSAKDGKTQVKEFLTKLKAVNSDFAAEVSDDFFYNN